MTHTDYSGAIRKTMMAAMGADAYMEANVYAVTGDPFQTESRTLKGKIHGYRYVRQNAGAAALLGLPGELADSGSSEWFMDLTKGFPITVDANDQLMFANGDTRRVSLVSGSGGFAGFDIYRLYRLEAV